MTDDNKVSKSKPTSRAGGIAARFGSQNQNCTVCGKVAYFMERLEADGKYFHKTCFRCTECNKTLRYVITLLFDGCTLNIQSIGLIIFIDMIQY